MVKKEYEIEDNRSQEHEPMLIMATINYIYIYIWIVGLILDLFIFENIVGF